MKMSNFNLRNVTPDVMLSLKKEAARQKISVNSLILFILEKDLGLNQSTKKSVYHDLDYLAGTWTEKDKQVFDDKIKHFENIDKELWM